MNLIYCHLLRKGASIQHYILTQYHFTRMYDLTRSHCVCQDGLIERFTVTESFIMRFKQFLSPNISYGHTVIFCINFLTCLFIYLLIYYLHSVLHTSIKKGCTDILSLFFEMCLKRRKVEVLIKVQWIIIL